MKHIVVLFCILLISAFALPVAASVGTVTTEPVIIHGVTMEPTFEPTKEPTKEPTAEPTREPTKEPTSTQVVVTTPVGPQVGWVTIASTPSAASVTLDGRSVGVTPVAGLEVGAGTSHSVRISMNGYEPFQTSFSVSPGEQAAVDGTLSPVVTPVPTTEPTKAPTAPVTPVQPIGGDKGWFRVHCNVDGAQASLDNGAAGTCTIAQGSCSIQVATTGTPVSSFTVTKSGYQTYTNPVAREPAKGETVDLYATLNPIPVPAYGSIQVASSPSGAVATLDGGSWQYTPCTFSSVIAGSSHTVQVSMSGYQPYTTTAYVAGGQTAYVSISLVPNPPYPNTGSLNVATSPKGADIYVDGRYVAQSPGVIPGLVPGSHSVRLHKAGYDEYVNTFTVYAGQQTPVSVTLNPQQSTVGSIEVSSVPAGSSLYLDGHYMGLTPSGDYFDLSSLVPGSHTVLLRHTNYQDYSQTVYVGGGKVVTVNAVLTQIVPGPTPFITGQIVAASVPPGAEFFLDNVYKGITPLSLSDIPAGSHVVTMKEAGYTDNVQTVTVVGGQSTAVAATLTQPTPTATPTKSPMTVVPVVGAIVLVGAVLLLKRR
jgi:hypothetical protein